MSDGSYWARPANARKYHIFADDGRSLCSNWMMWNTGEQHDDFDPEKDEYRQSKDCKKCAQRSELSL